MPTPAAVIADATADDLAAIREMLYEYRDWLQVDLCFQSFDAEVQALPWQYAPPAGALLIARAAGRPVGMIALRPAADGRCEMKRLYVRAEARGSGLGRQLVDGIIAAARARGYREMILDTLPVMQSAQRLYEEVGFLDIEPYYASPIAGTRYMALRL